MEKLIHRFIKTWEQRCYFEGIPDESPSEINDKVPSYKKICLAILNNDAKALGIERKKSIYYDSIKKEDLKQRGMATKKDEIEIYSKEYAGWTLSELNAESVRIANAVIKTNPNTYVQELKTNRKKQAVDQLIYEKRKR